MAKTDRKTEAVAAVALASAVPFGREPRTSRGAQARGKREEHAAGPTEEQSGTIAEPPLRSLAQPIQTEKRRSKRLRPWAFFRLIGELFADGLHRVRHPRRRKKRGRRNRRKSSRAHARTTPSFCFSPSPISSNSLVHNALRVKISHILTQRRHHTTRSGSTACGRTAVKQHEAAPASPRFTPVHPTLGRRMRA